MLIYRKCVVVQGQGEQINPKSDEIDKEVYILTFHHKLFVIFIEAIVVVFVFIPPIHSPCRIAYSIGVVNYAPFFC